MANIVKLSRAIAPATVRLVWDAIKISPLVRNKLSKAALTALLTYLGYKAGDAALSKLVDSGVDGVFSTAASLLKSPDDMVGATQAMLAAMEPKDAFALLDAIQAQSTEQSQFSDLAALRDWLGRVLNTGDGTTQADVADKAKAVLISRELGLVIRQCRASMGGISQHTLDLLRRVILMDEDAYALGKLSVDN